MRIGWSIVLGAVGLLLIAAAVFLIQGVLFLVGLLAPVYRQIPLPGNREFTAPSFAFCAGVALILFAALPLLTRRLRAK